MSSLVLFASDAARTSAFYLAIGVPLQPEDHGEGPIHMAAEISDVHFAVYQADGPPQRSVGWRAAGSDFPGLYVESLDEVVARLEQIGAPLLVAHQERPWGCRVVAQDPDGRAVEVNQNGHCPEQPS